MNLDYWYIVATGMKMMAATKLEGEDVKTSLTKLESLEHVAALLKARCDGEQAVEQGDQHQVIEEGDGEQDVAEGSKAGDEVRGEVDHVIPELSTNTAVENMEVCLYHCLLTH